MSEQSSSILLPAGQLPQCTCVHWMPFGINFDGPAAPAQYFDPQPEADAPSTSQSSSRHNWEASFRGRQLKGASKSLPEGYQGLLLKPAGNSGSSSTSDTQQRSWQAVGSFSECVIWGHDVAPAATDPHVRCMGWLALADQVHQPVTAAQVEEELKTMQQQGLVR